MSLKEIQISRIYVQFLENLPDQSLLYVLRWKRDSFGGETIAVDFDVGNLIKKLINSDDNQLEYPELT